MSGGLCVLFGMQKDLELARSVLIDESEAMRRLADSIGEAFTRAVDVIETCATSGGNVLVSGLGKSGLVGAKISATLASLGVPSHSVHPSEAAHGDLGRFRPTDSVICLSKSGETEEVVNLAAILRQDGLPIVSITAGSVEGNSPSSLERLSDVALHLGTQDEAGHAPAPTTSTTLTLAMGDALALAAASRMGFTDADFARRHPGGTLGGMLRPVTDVLRFRAGDSLPLVRDSASVGEALADAARQSDRRPGALLLIDPENGRLTGIFTDGDLRRLVLRDATELDRPIGDVMTKSPRVLPSSALVRDAVTLVREHRQDEVPVVDEHGRPVGLLDVQDLIAMKLVRA